MSRGLRLNRSPRGLGSTAVDDRGDLVYKHNNVYYAVGVFSMLPRDSTSSELYLNIIDTEYYSNTLCFDLKRRHD